MIHQFWRLSEAGEKNLGLPCTGDGLLLGRTPLVERRDVRFVVREPGEVDRLLTRAYQNAPPLNRLTPGFAAVAAALNANDLCLAHIVAVHLRIPDLPSQVARDAMEAEDVLIKSAARNRPFHVQTDKSIHKASPDDAKHPGWPAGTPGGLGGKFRPKDDAESAITQQIENKIERIMMRRAIRTAALAVLRLTFAVEGRSPTISQYRFLTTTCDRRGNGGRCRSHDCRIQRPCNRRCRSRGFR